MMQTRRKEPFRYSMEEPLECWIEITSIGDIQVPGKLASVELMDISKTGCKIRTELDLHANDHRIKAVIHFQLEEEMYKVPGEIRWQRQLEPPYEYYGILLSMSEDDKERFNVELRTLAALRRIKVM
ncbi:PilZ domain-containing protein [Paenibacillus sp. CAA11]|uniref:PilZ domain-containing protein n=1 Tax=Paenibacillus sp. CAA11 TaxID=1532905 RepID=UPI000D3B2320|nr:PilZ domain-containing protein [Paenibacillus sp. CAA11]AWB45760.1 PilZ domain-containing protein [Paenibacillus sp. CAA11]